MKKLILLITLFTIGTIGCGYHPTDISDKEIPAEILLEANKTISDSLSIYQLFIIHGNKYDYIFTKDESNIKLYAKYDTNDSGNVGGIGFIIGLGIGLVLLILVSYKS